MATAMAQRPAVPRPAPAVHRGAGGSRLCYAFEGGVGFEVNAAPGKRDRGPIWVSCGHLRQRATAGSVWSFAVSSTKMVLAVAGRTGRVRLFSLLPPYRRLPWYGPQSGNFIPTCGTIVNWSAQGTRDGLSGALIAGDGAWVACDRKRQLRLTLTAAARRPGGRMELSPTLLTGAASSDDFAVSPNGRFIAWTEYPSFARESSWPVCVLETHGGSHAVTGCAPACELGWHAESAAVLGSVADDGAVIFEAWSMQTDGCPWCDSVYYWNPKWPPRLPVLLARSGSAPQWITSAAARALVARYKYLRARRKRPARKGPQGSKKARLPAA
jgi:hypothetical protein